MKNISASPESTKDATKLAFQKSEDDNLSPSKPFLACADLKSAQPGDSSADPEMCDSLVAAKQAVYPVAAGCVILLTLLGVCYSLYFTKAVMLPIVGAFLLNFLFGPLVLKMNRVGIPNVLGTFIVLVLSIGAILIALAFAYQPATTWLAEKDQNMRIMKQKLNMIQQPIKAINDVTEQIDEISSGRAVENVVPDGEESQPAETDSPSSSDDASRNESSNDEPDARSSNGEAGLNNSESKPADDDPRGGESDSASTLVTNAKTFTSSPAPELNHSVGQNQAATENLDEHRTEPSQQIVSVIPVEVQQPSISNRIFSTTGDAFAGISLMLVLLFYLLSAGDRGLEKLVKLMPTFQGKKRVVELSRAIEKSISDYLLTTTLINFGLGIVIGTGMWAIGMPNPILWGVMAMFLNFFPFVGAIIGAVIVFLAAIVSFDSIAYSAWAPAIYLFANLIEANFITPILLGRSVSLHPVWLMIFFVIVAWVWGLGGAIIAVPVLAVIKITCDHVEPLIPVGEFLGR